MPEILFQDAEHVSVCKIRVFGAAFVLLFPSVCRVFKYKLFFLLNSCETDPVYGNGTNDGMMHSLATRRDEKVSTRHKEKEGVRSTFT